ncbi:CoA transferase [Pseudomonas putida]|uniref:CaiB/BaiF CoA transferase family protein n=1 Tax=Pseudomonas putida TaxID=303 RepID=UPI00300EE373
MAGPLAGVRVLDLTSNFMGPYASLLMADMGADICKIEAPAGDPTRGVGPCRNPGMSAIFLHLNRNKRSAVLDLKHPQAAQALQHMLASADVVLHSLRPKAMAKLGLTYDQVRKVNPRIIYCGAFGFGQNGPYADRPAYVATAIADRIVGMAACNAISMALYYREKTGHGQAVEVPMFETFAHFVLGDHLYGHTFEPPIGDWGYARMMSAERRPYQTQDGYLGVNIYTDRHWQRFFLAIGRPDMADDPRYGTIFGRTENIGYLYEFLADTFATKTTAQWLSILTEADIPVIEMNTPETLLHDPHMEAVDFFQVQEHPSEGLLRMLGIPQQWSESQPEQRYPAPRLGEHTVQLLTEYGLTTAQAQQVVMSGGAVQAADETAASA